MSRFFYEKLAFSNMKKNSQTYIPYMITCIGTVMMYYMMHFLSVNKGLGELTGGAYLKTVMNFGTYVIAVFSTIFLFYTNSFLIKRRKKEFGLFNILGMEKKHVARIVLLETIYTAIISLTAGLILGILCSKLMFLFLLKLLQFDVPMGFEISGKSIVMTIVLFCGIFLLNLLNNLRQIHLANPIELLKGGQVGEKEPKTKWLMAILGFLCLGIGYYMSISIESPLSAFNLFFVAVLLVIVGTYFLFIAGSVAILKLLRKNKNYFYKTKHFIGISGMIYRMKQNGAGLANICILSTMVLVILSSTVALYIGIDDVMKTRYPRQISVQGKLSTEDAKRAAQIMEDTAKDEKIEMENEIHYVALDCVYMKNGNCFSGADRETLRVDDIWVVEVLTEEEYNRLTGKKLSLKENEGCIYVMKGKLKENHLQFGETEFTVRYLEECPVLEGDAGSLIWDACVMVVKDDAVRDSMIADKEQSMGEPLSFTGGFDVDISLEKKEALINKLDHAFTEEGLDIVIECRDMEKEDFYSIYGGLFFLGIFLGLLFIMATVLIIYYKQISEGFEDKERFYIMQKVGLSRSEVKKTINSQVLKVFFFPLLLAGIHIAAAFPMITKMLALLQLTNTKLFICTTLGSIGVFALFYALVYHLTAKVYMKLALR